jgi:hypothetical protein
MENLTIVIHWRGPYTEEEVMESNEANGLYLLAGIQKYKQRNEIQYCGITEGKFRRRLTEKHHKMPKIHRKLNIWLGQIKYPIVHNRYHLELAEAMIIYFWQGDLNSRKRDGVPKPTTVISQWYKKNGDPRFNQHPLCKNLHDVLSWDGAYWRTGNLKVYGNY